MRLVLKKHPDSSCAAVARIEVEVARSLPNNLTLRYLVSGKVDELRLPAKTAPARADDLWRHTCFEAFIRTSSDGGYLEFNFAPSTQWAAYRFSGYRNGMNLADDVGAPNFGSHSSDTSYELQVALALPVLPADQAWHLGLSAVIEEADGAKSYWALAHPPGRADFHHSDCFVLELPAA